MNLNIFNINFSKLKFSFKKKNQKTEKVNTFSKDIQIEIINEYPYMLSLKRTNTLILSYPDYLVKYYSENKEYEGKLIGSIDELKNYYILFNKLLTNISNHNKHFLKKNIKVNGRACQFNILELRDNDGIYAFIIISTLFTKNKIINSNDI